MNGLEVLRLAGSVLLFGGFLWAAPGKGVDFNREIRPILSDKCFACHGPDEQNRKANLRLDVREGALPRVVVPGKPEESKLLKRITLKGGPLRMPPNGEPLDAKQVAAITEWINQGAPWETHWSYTPPKRPAEPPVKLAAWPRNPIDKFILARLEKEGLQPSPAADRATLLRRLSFDLTGLPPTPEEIAAFVKDKSKNAYEKQVDRLLASPHYGERMAMPWLDLSRYADTHGFHIDSHRDMWRWREWVIEAFNTNQPFNQFVVEQLAGDLLPNATTKQKLATGFNRNHMINFEGGAIDEEYQTEYVIDRVDTTATAFMGMTMGCARCHDHKYDPIRQKDFYQFAAFFNTIPEKGLDGTRGNAAPLLPLPSPEQAARKSFLAQRVPELEKQLDAAEVKQAQTTWETQAAATWKEPSRQGLLAHYEMEGGFADSSGNYLHGQSLRDDPGFPQSWSGGRAAELNGRSEVELGRLPWPKSLAFWFRTQARTFKNGILSRLDGQHRGWEIYLDGPYAIPRLRQMAHLVVRKVERWPDRVWEARTKQPILVKGKRNPDGWMHLAFVGDQFFLDGEAAELEVLRNTLTGPLAEPNVPVTIGGRPEADRLRGRLDDLRFYSRTLSPEEVRYLAQQEPLRAILQVPAPQRAREQSARLREWFLANEAAAPLRTAYTELTKLKAEQELLEWEIPTVMVMAEAEKPRETFLLARGDYRNKTERVFPQVPAALPPLPKGVKPDRLALANWLVTPDHPLTARVAVNRFWQMYFGLGIVKTVEDFGSQGEAPVHPELLDWLATEFVRSGWDVKAMQRLLVTSATYQQASRATPALLEKDPENRLLARGPRFRLPAEMVRDNALRVSGLLHAPIGGPSVLPYQPPGLWEELAFGAEFSAQVYEQSHGKDLYRRSMYTFWKRTSPPTTMSTFDAPDREKCVVRRSLTNTPLQALALLNDTTYVEASRVLAARVLQEVKGTPAQRLQRAYQLVLGRNPQPKEAAVLLELVQRKTQEYAQAPDEAKKLLAVGESPAPAHLAAPELAGWTMGMSVLLNLDETITKE